jgi:hypothetical protein
VRQPLGLAQPLARSLHTLALLPPAATPPPATRHPRTTRPAPHPARAQVLPLVPPDPEYFSPYSGLDANCGNPLLIDLAALITEGLLEPADAPPPVPDGDVQFEAVAATKAPLLQKAARALLAGPRFAALRERLAAFRTANPWIEDSALFDALRQQPALAGLDWWEWPAELRFREPGALAAAHEAHKDAVDEFVAVQFLFDRQWRALKARGGAGGGAALAARMAGGCRFQARARGSRFPRACANAHTAMRSASTHTARHAAGVRQCARHQDHRGHAHLCRRAVG